MCLGGDIAFKLLECLGKILYVPVIIWSKVHSKTGFPNSIECIESFKNQSTFVEQNSTNIVSRLLENVLLTYLKDLLEGSFGAIF